MVYVHQKIPPHLLMTLCEFFTGGWMCGGINPFFYLLMKQGWVKLHRQITDWEWYTDGNTFRVFLHLLLNANHKDSRYKGIIVKRGQILTGRKSLAIALGLSERQVRTAISKLKNTGEIDQEKANKTTKSGSIITICNYECYQDNNDMNDQETNKQTTNKRPTNDH